MPTEKRRKAGRPRSETAREAVLEAAYEIVMNEGIGRLTVERVAAEAGVGKPTIYRSWSNAHELAMAAFIAKPGVRHPTSNGTARERLHAHLHGVIEAFSTTRGRQITLTLASADQASELTKAFRNQVILKSRELGRELLEQGIQEGTVDGSLAMDVVLDMLYGPVFFRLLAGHAPVNAALADNVLKMIFEGIGSED